ncbi:MAG: hypothetical protein OXF09_05225 [Hyphomicrobiales bacterium]|nr:hypothetical protein [Hyphomicrobiales bacterium]
MITKPFHEIIFDICGKRVIPFDVADSRDAAFLDVLNQVCKDTCRVLKDKPIVSKRVNEVGNKIESYVVDLFNSFDGYTVPVPFRKKSGYPDILVIEYDNRYTYVECKTHNRSSVDSSFRSFFFSNSKTFKVEYDARHLVVGFEIIQVENQQFRPTGFKIVDAYDLPCTLKQEWNSNNKLLYGLPVIAQYNERNSGK